MKQRLQKIIASSGISSRRKAEDLIKSKRVKINGSLASLGSLADPESDDIELDGELIFPEEKKYILLNKPEGYVCTMKDTHNRPIINSLINISERIFPIGRLDINTSGLILLTNDGNFSNTVNHPKNKIVKRYIAITKKPINFQICEALQKGFYLNDGFIKVDNAIPVNNNMGIQIDIHIGRNRIVRRMLEHLKNPVVSLKRTNIGNLNLYGLELGRWRTISKDERDKLLP